MSAQWVGVLVCRAGGRGRHLHHPMKHIPDKHTPATLGSCAGCAYLFVGPHEAVVHEGVEGHQDAGEGSTQGLTMCMPLVRRLSVRTITPAQAAAVAMPALEVVDITLQLGEDSATELSLISAAALNLLWAAENLEIRHTYTHPKSGEDPDEDTEDMQASQAVTLFGALSSAAAERERRGLPPACISLYCFVLSHETMRQLVESFPRMTKLRMWWVRVAGP